MKAAVCRVHGEPMQIEDVTLAEPAAAEVLVTIRACAICHSDIFAADGAWGGKDPAVYGHEAAGIVEAVGPGVSEFVPGDHVVVTLIRSCGECHYCLRGREVNCEGRFTRESAGPLFDAAGQPLVQGLDTAAFAERALVHRSQVCKVLKDLPFDVASLLACGVITGFGAVTNTVHVEAGASVVVIGCGGVGLNSLQGARHAGAACIIAADLNNAKLEAARAFGATHVVNPAEEDLRGFVKAHTAGRGADYVFVTVGAKAAIDQAIRLLARGGTAVIVGMPERGTRSEYDPNYISALSLTIVGSKMGSARVSVDIPELVSLYRKGKLKLDELISGRYPLEQINEAIDDVKHGDALRNVIVF